jgi:chromosome partitioning protein
MKTIALANHKGGVGKTATAHALGTVLATEGWRVLLVDIDPQASLTGACGQDDTAGRSMAEVLGDTDAGTLELRQIARRLAPNLTLAPSDIALASTELALVVRLGREMVLRQALDLVAADFDVALIDCPPSLSLLTVNALTAADGVVVPTQPQAADLRGLRLFLATLDKVRVALNPRLALLGVLVTFYDGRLLHHQEACSVMAAAGLPLFDTRIGRSVRVAEAVGVGESIMTFEPDNARAGEYRGFAQEVAGWLSGA